MTANGIIEAKFADIDDIIIDIPIINATNVNNNEMVLLTSHGNINKRLR